MSWQHRIRAFVIRAFDTKAVRKVFGRRPPFRERFKVGRGTYGEPKVLWEGPSTLEVGSFCSFAGDVTVFLGGNHRTDWITTYPFSVFWGSARCFVGHPQSKGNVTIGNDVWIGHGATILSGIMIGNGAVIGACSVVTKDVPAYTIVAGNPAKTIRKRFSDDQIAALERIAWWDWSDHEIAGAMPLLLSGDFLAFENFSVQNND